LKAVFLRKDLSEFLLFLFEQKPNVFFLFVFVELYHLYIVTRANFGPNVPKCYNAGMKNEPAIIKEWIVRTPGEMKEIAVWALDELMKTAGLDGETTPGAKVLGLYGDLGSGKTTFTQILARELGVTETVTSPTFVIEKYYELDGTKSFKKLVHIDAYRLKSSHELKVIGWEELVKEPKTLIAIEWPEKVADIMPPHLQLHFSMEGEHNRKVEASYI